jgi:hypothetical protein
VFNLVLVDIRVLVQATTSFWFCFNLLNMLTDGSVQSVLLDPVAFEIKLRELECPSEGLAYANALVDVFRQIRTVDANQDANAILGVMEDLQVSIDHANERIGEVAITWLEASVQLIWDRWSIRFNRRFANLYRHHFNEVRPG